MSQHHIYTRSLDEHADSSNSLAALARLVPPGSHVLDLGCGAGALGQFLAQQKSCSVDGVTLSQGEADLARPYYRDLVVADLEQLNLAEAFHGRQYSRIICADVLEHLKEPERILAACRSLLQPDGQLLISIPNASYSGLLLELMQGEFRYRTEGLLDRTHLRFFTRQSLLRFLAEEGWAIHSLSTIERPLDDSEFKHTHPDSLPPAVVRYLLAQPDALTYQFICIASPSENCTAQQTSSLLAHNTQAIQAHPSFTSDLYWGNAGELSEAQKLTRRGQIGQLHQSLRFTLPACDVPHPMLRWDPADRPGFLHLHRIHLYDAQGQLRWAWNHTQPSSNLMAADLPHSGIHLQPAGATAPSSLLLLLTSDDPWLHLPIPADVLRPCLSASGCVLDIALGWPMSADYVALSSHTQAMQADLVRADQEISHWQQQYQGQTHALHVQAHQLQHQQEITAHYQALHSQLQAQLADHQHYIRSIEASRSYRAMQKLGRIKQRVLAGPGLPVPPQATQEPPSHAVAPAQQPSPPPPSAPELAPAPVSATPAEAASPATPQPAIAATAAPAVDIIIPVYRGLEDTRRCLTSVLSAPCSTPLHIIVINDASPEPALTTWLREFAQQEPRLTLLENEHNLGFVATVNRGMALHPTHDVLLLNSDTEVANNWLDRLHATAYRQASTGTVTPFSNNATICSYPRFCADNPLPTGFTTHSLDALCAHTHAGGSIAIPTAVGFCMYIRRDCLQQTGLFDTEHFGKGYGEENDFCMRAHNLGWNHQLALDTFVLHTGGVSFGESKTPREQAAYATLQRLHPEYDTLVQAHLQANPGQAARNALDIARMQASALPCVLMITHSLGGGTLRHVQELAQWLRPQANTLVLIPLPEHMLRLQWQHPEAGYTQDFHWPNDAQALRDTLQALRVCHIHYHHLLGLNPGLLQLPAELALTYDFTAHDYYSACPQITLTLANHHYCEEQGPAQCASCLQQRPAPTGENIEDWRLRHRHFLAQARYVLTPSRDAARRLQRYFPQANLRYAPHLDIADPAQLPPPAARRVAEHSHLRIFILGGVSASKGGEVMQAVAQAATRSQAPIELHLIGYPHRPMPVQPHASLTVHGPYAEADLPLLLARLQPDLVWFPALWPETYSYTLSACLQAGLPIIAPNLGAFTERLSQRPWTWLQPWHTTPDDWLRLFLDIRQRHFVDGQTPPPAPAAPEYAQDHNLLAWSYAEHYLSNLPNQQPPVAVPNTP